MRGGAVTSGLPPTLLRGGSSAHCLFCLVAQVSPRREVGRPLLSRLDELLDDAEPPLDDARRLLGRPLHKVVLPEKHEHLVGVRELPGHKGLGPEGDHDVVPCLHFTGGGRG